MPTTVVQQVYKHLKNKISKECKIIKEVWLKEKCQKIEEDIVVVPACKQETDKMDVAFKKIKQNIKEMKRNCGNVKHADEKSWILLFFSLDSTQA